jgi:hypothetical protein
MQNADWRKTAELIGITAIVASLIFVGLQMKQQQEIAIAAQYQERYATIMEFWTAREQSDIERPRLGGAVMDRWGLPSGIDPNMTPDRFGSRYLWTRMTLSIWDNLHFQYESGFLTDEAWAAYRSQFIRNVENPVFHYVIDNNKSGYRQSFLDLWEELKLEIE